ncbi:MAG: inositol monophosphatase [Pseudolabrys sp.]|nr:inositol monophosphatase [Pseudolabrys sp.]MBV9954142.1 inositol monophosphatase [Pseudolabrys sp.]
MSESTVQSPQVGGTELEDIEALAIELANLAGAEIKAALGTILKVRYKTGAAEKEKQKAVYRDPVSEVDRKVEELIRTRLGKQFPDHDIIGEEMEHRPGFGHDFVWAIDPVDGTTNFVNGFPLFAASIGVLYRGEPVVGAVWCSASHALRAGIYHATLGGKLRFEGSDVTPKVNPDVRRRLAGVPVATAEDSAWETRKTGSAAIECAMVAAGLLQVARFVSPNIWDVAGGLALVRAAGGSVRTGSSGNWTAMSRFEPAQGPSGKPDLRYWRQPIVIGTKDAVDLLCAA